MDPKRGKLYLSSNVSDQFVCLDLKTEKIAVKKFKLNTLPVNELFSYCSSFNCTLSTGNYALEDMEVMNK